MIVSHKPLAKERGTWGNKMGQQRGPTDHEIRTTLRKIYTSRIEIRSLMESFQEHTGG